MTNPRLSELLAVQDQVVSRRQVLDSGGTPSFLRRKLRRREWVRFTPGVYVAHTGPLTWRQRAWAAVLGAGRGALSHESALVVAGVSTKSHAPIHVAVGRKHAAPKLPGVVIHRYARLDERVMWHLRPPRVRVEHAVLDVASAAPNEADAVACLADAVQARATTAERLQSALAGRQRTKRRSFLAGVLDDVRAGTCSVLEHAYLTGVERAHGLPTPERQAPTTRGRRGFRDVDYEEWGLVVELDGQLWHDNARARDRDLERDLDAAVAADRETIRLGWGQVYRRPCSTARKVGAMLAKLGWAGEVTPCPRC